MSDDNKLPDSLDHPAVDQYVSDDPMSDRQAEGFSQAATAIGQNPAVQQAMDFKGNLQNYDQMLTSAIAGDKDAQDQLAEHSLGTAMASVQGVGGKAPSKPSFKVTSKEGETKLIGKNVEGHLRDLGSDYGWWLENEDHNLPFENPVVIEALQVHPSAQGKGLGSAALQRLEKEAKKNGHDSVFLNASPLPGLGNETVKDESKYEDLIRFYKKHGYEMYNKGEGGATMIKDLSKKATKELPMDEASRLGKFDPKQAKSGKLSFAKGGSVPTSIYAPVPKLPVAGLTGEPNSAISPSDSATGPDQLPTSLDSPAIDSYLSTPSAMAANGKSPLDSANVDQYLEAQNKEDKYGSAGQIAKTAAEGFGQGVLGPVVPATETMLGLATAEDIRNRAETNPGTHIASEIGGFIAPALLSGGTSALSKAAQFSQLGALEKMATLFPKAQSLAGKIGIGAAKGIVENALIAGSDETSKMILKDPNQSAQTAVANIGLSGVLGGAFGASLPIAGKAIEYTVGDKASKFVHDFKARVAEHTNNPNPVESMTNELADYYQKITSSADEVYGANGLKARDIAKAIPELKPAILEQSQSVYNTGREALAKMASKPNSYPERLVSKLESDLDNYASAISGDGISSANIFDATQELKQQLQSYAKFDKFVKPTDEAYDFVRDAKSLAHDLRNALEDKDVWGAAAKRQQEINSAFKDYLPALKDFERKFTVEVGGEKQIDPAKISTYINQLDKPSAEIKREMLKNFLDASEKYKSVINDSHTNLGLDPLIDNAPMNVTLRTTGKNTLGEKVADAFVNKALSEAGGSALGASTGATLGALVAGHMGAGVGAILGEKALGKFFSTILPSIAKKLLDKPEVSGISLKAAADYALSVDAGEQLMTKATQNIFKEGKDVLPESAIPTVKDLDKLNKQLKQVQVDPEVLLKKKDPMAHYMPEHSMSMNETTANAVTLLNQMRADVDKKAPLDSKPIMSSVQSAKFQNALTIAQQPLIVLDKIKKGTLTQEDVTLLGNMYPALYNRLKDKLNESIINKVNKEELISYKTRIGLSMFLAQPLDTTLTPMAIQSAQLQPQGGQQDQQPAQKQNGVKSSPALQKLPGMYQTQGNARQIRQNKE